MATGLQKGEQLAQRYTLQRELGRGADSATWLAADRKTRASVALKILTSDRRDAESLRTEWQTSLRLMHAHIARAFEFHTDASHTFYSMQFVDGPDATVLSGAGVEAVLPAMASIADALRYSHGKNVVHRDIKAANVLIDGNGAPFLIDFGSASPIGETATGGSMIAQSPQSLAGEASQTADDIFALGGLIYELIAGRSAFAGDDVEDAIQHQTPTPLTAADGSSVPPALVALVARMLSHDAALRPSAEDVVEELTQVGFAPGLVPQRFRGVRTNDHEEIVAAKIDPVRTEHRASKPLVAERSGLNRRTVGIALAVLLALLVGVVFVLPNTVDDDAEPVASATDAADSETETPAVSEEVLPERDARVVARSETEAVLGRLLSRMETLENRAVQRWGGMRFRQVQAVYEAGDAAYLARDYATAIDRYAEAIEQLEPLLDEVDDVFKQTMDSAQLALDAADSIDAVELFELAVAISPSSAAAQAGYERAKNLDSVLSLTDQGVRFENDLELEAALQSFARAVELDPAWQPAIDGRNRVQGAVQQMRFDTRMSEGLIALADGHYEAARAAFRMAQELKPGSREPADGLLQVDQGLRLNQIQSLEGRANYQASNEEWESAISTYEQILEIDANLVFAQEGLSNAQRMTALHEQLDGYIEEPDSLSSPSTMRAATTLVVDITRMPEVGPRLGEQRDQLSVLLKRAATPLTVTFFSDNQTDVAVYKVGKLGNFETHQMNLRPGTYVVVGSRPGYRDVRVEFRVAPEAELAPIVIRCEEPI
ncbi:MAG: serine/threonine-protein kinase [Pseudomonadota bacterium]